MGAAPDDLMRELHRQCMSKGCGLRPSHVVLGTGSTPDGPWLRAMSTCRLHRFGLAAWLEATAPADSEGVILEFDAFVEVIAASGLGHDLEVVDVA